MKILFADVETTGLDPLVDRVVEIGVALYCTDHQRLLRSACFLTNDDTIKIRPEITAINKVAQKMLDENSAHFNSVLHFIENDFVNKCDFICAHNSPFDKSFLEAEIIRTGKPIWDKPWIDTCVDIPYPSRISSRKLVHLAAEHGFLIPDAHTSLSDVLGMMKLFCQYPVEEIIKRQQSPNITLRALVDYAERDKASKRGYIWNPTTKKWLKTIKELELEKEKSFGFDVEIQK